MSPGVVFIIIPLVFFLFFVAMNKANKHLDERIKEKKAKQAPSDLQPRRPGIHSAHILTPPAPDRPPPTREEIFTAWIADPQTRTITPATWNADINTIWSILKLEKFWASLKVQVLDENHAALIPYLARSNARGENYKSLSLYIGPGAHEEYLVPVLIVGAEDPVKVTGIQDVTMTKEQIQKKINWHLSPQEREKDYLDSMRTAHEYFQHHEQKKRNSSRKWG